KARRTKYDHRLSRPLYDGAKGADRLPPAPDRRDQGPRADACGVGKAYNHRRPDPRKSRGRSAQVAALTWHRPHDLLTARLRHGPSHRGRGDLAAMVAAL